MKKVIEFIIIVLIGLTVYYYRNQITEYITLNFIYKNEFVYDNISAYQKEDFSYFKQTDNYKPQNKQEILNIIYSGINNGYDEINFFCSFNYKECSDDLKDIINNDERLGLINNFVSPYNTYKQLDININALGKITIYIYKYYHKDMIQILNEQIDSIINQIITNNMTTQEKLKAVHDYIINNTTYDKEKEMYLNTNIKTTYNSELAIGPLLEGHGICSGYSDAYSLFLDKLGIKNYRISNDDHIWNFVYLDNNWYHIDLTWDDPVTNTGKQLLKYDYFLINTNELLDKDITQHTFNDNIFIEAKKA